MKFKTLGKSGLKVSEIALGTMTFGWGADQKQSEILFNTYKEAGGNFFDTADGYAGGKSEEILGDLVNKNNFRDKAVIATKFSFNSEQGNPNAGGNGRKNIRRALEGSLKRLKTDYIDLYILHAWDKVTPVEEVMSTLNDLVREGKVLHLGFSDVPAWYASRAQTIAEQRGWERLVSLQLEYSLIARNLEREHLPLALETGISITPWSPLGSGFLTGKYKKVDGQIIGGGRVVDVLNSGNPILEKFGKDERNWEILETVLKVSKELDITPTEVSLAWLSSKKGIASILVGATKIEQLEENLKAINVKLPESCIKELDIVSAITPNELDHFFGDVLQTAVNGVKNIQKSY